MAEAEKTDIRKFERFRIKTMSQLNNTDVSVINVSKEGMMVSGRIPPDQSVLNIRLKINGKWVEMKGARMWCIDNGSSQSVLMGLCISQAPPEYQTFVNNLYLETATQKPIEKNLRKAKKRK